MDEQELTRRLQDAARGVSVDAPTLGSIAAPAPGGPRPGWIGVGLAAMVLAGVTAVVLTRGDSGQQVATAPAESSVSATNATAPSTLPGPVPEASSATASGLADASDASGSIDSPGSSEGGSSSRSESSDVESTDTPPTVEVERTFGDITVRFVEGVPTYSGYVDQLSQGAGDSAPVSLPDGVFFTPATPDIPQDCNYATEAELTVDGGEFSAGESASLYYTPGPADGPMFTWIPVGTANASNYLVVIVRNGADATSATMSAFGAEDSTELVDGYAILMVRVDGDAGNAVYDELLMSEAAQIDVTVTKADGTTVGAVDGNLDTAARCSPPPMPAPGVQPNDPEAATRSIQSGLARLSDRSVPADQKRALLNDWSGVDQAVSSVGGDEATWKIKDKVFTSPTEMWFRYYARGANPEARMEGYGVARLVDGEWQFRREMLCQYLLVAGAECAGDIGGIGPATEALP